LFLLDITLQEKPDMDLMTVDEVAAMLKVPRTWVYARTCKSSNLEPIPFYRFGRLLRFKRAEIIAWAERQHQTSGYKPEGQQTSQQFQ
jgi:excisionase family DNA binding protein